MKRPSRRSFWRPSAHALPAGVTLLRYAVELVGSAGLAALEKRAKLEEK